LLIFKYIIETFEQSFNCVDACEISQLLIGDPGQEQCCRWKEGLTFFLQSNVCKRLFIHFRPEDKELFISQSLIEPVLHVLKTEAEEAANAVAKDDNDNDNNNKAADMQLIAQDFLLYKPWHFRGISRHCIIDKTIGNGLEPFKNGSYLCNERIEDDEIVILVPHFMFSITINFEKKEFDLKISSLATCDEGR
jgi:hypothetical protein